MIVFVWFTVLLTVALAMPRLGYEMEEDAEAVYFEDENLAKELPFRLEPLGGRDTRSLREGAAFQGGAPVFRTEAVAGPSSAQDPPIPLQPLGRVPLPRSAINAIGPFHSPGTLHSLYRPQPPRPHRPGLRGGVSHRGQSPPLPVL